MIDLDATRTSAFLIEKLNASPYISVRQVLHSPARAIELTRRDVVQGIIYLPPGLQAAMLRGDRSVRIGYLADDSNTAQNGELYSTLNEIAASIGAEVSVSRVGGVSSLGKNTAQTQATLLPLRVSFRYLTNPTGQAATATVINFLFFFSLMYQGMTCLMLIGRLRVTRVWESQVLSGSVLALIVRIVPYSLVFTAAVGTAMAILIVFGQLRFAGNIFVFFPLLFLCALANGMLAMLLSWRCANPGEGASFMIWLVLPGFILGGATMALGFAHDWVRTLSQGVPLVRLFGFWRDIGLRGLDFNAISGSVGWFLLYRVFLAILLTIRFRMDELKRRSEVRAYWRALGETGRGSQLSTDRG